MTYTDDDEKFARYWKHSTYSTAMKVFEESGAKSSCQSIYPLSPTS
jgi:hypothetical protein